MAPEGGGARGTPASPPPPPLASQLHLISPQDQTHSKKNVWVGGRETLSLCKTLRGMGDIGIFRELT